jgi:hypothetical protein
MIHPLILFAENAGWKVAIFSSEFVPPILYRCGGITNERSAQKLIVCIAFVDWLHRQAPRISNVSEPEFVDVLAKQLERFCPVTTRRRIKEGFGAGCCKPSWFYEGAMCHAHKIGELGTAVTS